MHLTTSLNMQWVAGSFAHLLRLPMAWYEKRHLGDVVSRFGSIGALQQTLTGGMVGAVVDGIMATITFIVMLLYSPRLAAVAGTAVCLYGLLRTLRYGALRRASGEQIVRVGKAAKLLHGKRARHPGAQALQSRRRSTAALT